MSQHSGPRRRGTGGSRHAVVALLTVVALVGVLPGSWAAPAGDEPPTVRAIIEVAVDTHPVGELRGRDVARQRQAIAAAQRQIRHSLVGTDHRIVRELGDTPYLVVEVAEEALPGLAELPGVARVVPDETFVPQLDQSVPHVEADQAWQQGFEGAGTAVAVLDTGVAGAHPFLAGKVVAEACFSDGDPAVAGSRLCPDGQAQQVGPGSAVPCSGIDGCGHGTHVAGIAAGLRDVGPGGGVAPAADVLAVQVFHGKPCLGGGEEVCLEATLSDLLAALEWVYDQRHAHDIAAVNLSLGGGQVTSVCDQHPLKESVDLLRSAGIATVASTGNNGWSDAVSAPACISSVVAVGATTLDDEITSFTNLHPNLVDLVAPGQDIVSSVPGGYARSSGTSMAAPHVAGGFALLRAEDPGATVSELVAQMREAGVAVIDQRTLVASEYPRLAFGQIVAPELTPGGACITPPFEDVPVDHPFCPEIEGLNASGVVNGFPDRTFRPTREVTRGAVAAFLYRLAGAPPTVHDDRFSDVPVDHPFAVEITWLAQSGLAQGFSDGTFRPRATLTRQALMAFLYRDAGQPEGDWEADFIDVGNDHPFATEIAWAATTEIAAGFEDGGFRPVREVTRQAAVVFLDRVG